MIKNGGYSTNFRDYCVFSPALCADHMGNVADTKHIKEVFRTTLRLVSISYCNLPQDRIVLKYLKLNSTPCVQNGLFGKVNVSCHPRWGTRPETLNSRRWITQTVSSINKRHFQILGALNSVGALGGGYGSGFPCAGRSVRQRQRVTIWSTCAAHANCTALQCSYNCVQHPRANVTVVHTVVKQWF
jgi:hypothetical protein